MNDIFFGIFKDIKDLYNNSIQVLEMYEGIFSEYYNDCLPISEYEREFYLNEAYVCGKDVLELCCGSGRLTVLFAEKGFNIDGIDLSANMLSLLDKRLEKAPVSVRKRVHCVKGDVFNIEVTDKKYDFIFLSATTICLLMEQPVLTHKLFDDIACLLNPNGSFMFDLRLYDQTYKVFNTEITCSINSFASEPMLVLYQEFVNFKPGRSIANFYIQSEKPGESMKKYISATNKKIISTTEIESLIKDSPLEISNIEIYKDDMYSIAFYTLKHAQS